MGNNRKKLSKATCKQTIFTIEEYSKDFLGYLKRIDFAQLDEIAGFENFVFNVFASLCAKVFETIRFVEAQGYMKDEDLCAYVENVVHQEQDRIAKLQTIDGFESIAFMQVVQRYRKSIRRAIKEVVEEAFSYRPRDLAGDIYGISHI